MTGSESALPLIMEGLARLEYRGYDSAGVVLVDGEDSLWQRRKAIGTKSLAELAADA